MAVAAYNIGKTMRENKKKSKAINDLFERADRNGNGRISVQDYVKIFSDHGVIVSPEEIQKVAQYANIAGELTKEDFTNYAKRSKFFNAQMDGNSEDDNCFAAKKAALERAERAFRIIDKDKDGFIDRQEFKKISTKLTPEHVAAIYAKFDHNKDELLSLKEFREMFEAEKK